MLVIKFHYANDIRRITISEDTLDYTGLQELARSLFGPSLPELFTFRYKDDEGDLITVSSPRELEEAFRLVKEQRILRVFIYAAEKPKNASSNTNGSFFDLLEKLVSENSFIRDLINNVEIEVKSIPTQLNEIFGEKHAAHQHNNNNKPYHHAICDACNTSIRGIRYKCQQCPDYDLCESCEPKKDNVHPAHTFEKITEPRRPRCPYRNQQDVPQSEVLHPANCDGCKVHIKGLRYKCTTCPDYDLCESCKSNGVHKETAHEFNVMTRPFFERRGRCTRGGQPRRPCDVNSIPQADVVHPATCDGCQNRIKGIRYKCLACPDFDLCESCESKQIHNEHKFNKILRPFGFWRCPTETSSNSNSMEPTKEETRSPSPSVPTPVSSPPQSDHSVRIPVTTSTPIVAPTPVAQPVIKIETAPTAPVISPVVSPVPSPVASPVISHPVKPVVEEKKESPVVERKTPEPVKKEVISPFEVKLNQLEEMGFSNKPLNINLLVKFNGDMIQTVRHLLDN